jgi:hypothetical protein
MKSLQPRLVVTVAIAMLVLSASTSASNSTAIVGALTSIDSAGIASGWAQDPDAPTASVDVHVYIDGPAGAGGTFIRAVTASVPRSAPGAGPHGFRFSIPSRYRDGAAHPLFVYGIDTSGAPADNTLLSAAPMTFTLASTVIRLQNSFTSFGVEPRCGGTLVEMSVGGNNFVNNADCTGRQVQAALYDGKASYDSCGGCQGVWGWNPVQGGDLYDFGSPLFSQTVNTELVYTATQPYEWYPDSKGGGPGQPVLSDVNIEQTASFVPGFPYAVRLHYKITHFGLDNHGYAVQEFPAVYVNRGYDYLVSYSGTFPWTGDAVSWSVLTPPGQPVPQRLVSERWAALVDSQGMGLTVYVPQQYPYLQGLQFAGTSGQYGSGANYFRPHVPFAFGPGSVLEADVYVIAGDYREARRAIEALHAAGPGPDVLPPYGALDVPADGAALSGIATVSGWVFDNTQVSRVNVLIDGAVAGAATYGFNRPDISGVFPNAPVQIGFSYALDSARYGNGQHQLVVQALDAAGNVAVLGDRTINVTNTGPAPDTTAPTASIVSIDRTDGHNLTINAQASDAIGVTQVEFYVDGQLRGSDTTSPYSLTIGRTTLSSGTHQFFVRAYDAAGNVGVSATVSWTKR